MRMQTLETFTYVVAMDNHDPTRNFAHGKLSLWGDPEKPTPEPTYVLENPNPWMGDRIFPDSNIGFILDNGKETIPTYLAGFNPNYGTIFIKPFPVNPENRTRPDNGRVIDFSTWALGPRKTYHLKISG